VADTSTQNLRVRLRRLFLKLVLGIAAVVAIAYVLDYAIFRLRVGENWNAFGSVIVTHFDAIPQKSGKTQLIFDPPAAQTCINSLFPHDGSLPCWYLRRHPEQQTSY
jgi:hypothetical protein